MRTKFFQAIANNMTRSINSLKRIEAKGDIADLVFTGIFGACSMIYIKKDCDKRRIVRAQLEKVAAEQAAREEATKKQEENERAEQEQYSREQAFLLSLQCGR